MNTKFTEGPWNVWGDWAIHDSSERLIAQFEDLASDVDNCVSDEAFANAKLIAAAPDLYEALESAVMAVNADILRVRPSDRMAFLNMLESWNVALSKARGEL